MWLNARAMLQLGYGARQRRIQATLTQNSGILAVELACDKEGTKTILSDAGIPVPQGTVIQYLDELEIILLLFDMIGYSALSPCCCHDCSQTFTLMFLLKRTR